VVSAIGAAVVGVAAIYAVSFLELSAVTTQHKSSLSISQVAMLAAMCVNLAVGGRINVTPPDGLALGTVTFVPVVATIVGLAVLTSVLRRRLDARRSLRALDVVVTGLESGAVFVACLLGVTLLGRLQLNVGSSAAVTVSGDVVAGLVHGAVLYVIAFALLVLWKFPAVLPPALRGARDWLAGPCYGAAVAVVLFSVASVVAGVVFAVHLFAAGSPDTSAFLMTAASALLPASNLVPAGFAFALGAPLTITGDTARVLNSFGSSGTVNVLAVAHQQPLTWIAVGVAALVVIIGGIVAALFAPSPADARKRGAGLGLTVSVLLVAVALSSRVSVRATVLDKSLDGGASLALGIAALVGLVWGALAGLIGAWLASKLPVSLAVRANVRINSRRAGRTLPRFHPGPGVSAGPMKPEGTW
jgi:hypothetical protein